MVAAWLGTTRAFAQFEQALVHGPVDLKPYDHSAALPAYAHPALPRAVRGATAYCEEHAGEPVLVAAMAAAAVVGPRTLQDRFRIDLGTTPVTLRRVRLDRAWRSRGWAPGPGPTCAARNWVEEIREAFGRHCWMHYMPHAGRDRGP
ncbi:hypothetical protein ACIBU0_35770 [Streptomyces sp. NPDC049627]|uniref:hypothetical protein n=1 Tax=Streptomyces sp. NPDC049627 TaxID=3365595 RepID=UPI0037ACDCFC